MLSCIVRVWIWSLCISSWKWGSSSESHVCIEWLYWNRLRSGLYVKLKIIGIFFLRLLLSPEKLVFHIFPSESECSHNYIQTQMWADKYTNTNRYTLASTQLSSQVRHLTPQSQDAEFPVPVWNLLLSFIIHDRVNKKDSRLLFGVRIIQSDGKYMCGHTISTLYSNG